MTNHNFEKLLVRNSSQQISVYPSFPPQQTKVILVILPAILTMLTQFEDNQNPYNTETIDIFNHRNSDTHPLTFERNNTTKRAPQESLPFWESHFNDLTPQKTMVRKAPRFGMVVSTLGVLYRDQKPHNTTGLKAPRFRP